MQGMSGPPIIQDGKLVGAVTCVMINDLAEKYVIFVENMLDAAVKIAKKRLAQSTCVCMQSCTLFESVFVCCCIYGDNKFIKLADMEDEL